jgi:hypothetical protein
MRDYSGFVYLLGNRAMPGIYKIGRTKGSVFARAAQLSNTSVPERFIVVCYMKTDDASRDEAHLHHFLGDFRINYDREFFRFRPEHMPWVLGLFEYHPHRIEYHAVDTWLLEPAESEDPENPWHHNDYEEPVMTRYRPVECWEIVYTS